MVSDPVRIAVDAMGGDYAPQEIVKGALEAQRDGEVKVLLVGPQEVLEEQLVGTSRDSLEVFDAPEAIHMGEKAALAVRAKENSSLVVAAKLCRERKADGLVSAGNTGAAMAAALLNWGRIPGVSRPAIAVVIPTPSGPVLLLDAGANAECKPENLLQFGQMGSAYTTLILGKKNPSVGLLNVGEEEGKGSELYQEAHRLLKESSLNFLGNVEGKDIVYAKTDVVVCDGFIGNVALKLLEGTIEVFFSEIKNRITQSFLNRTAGALLLPSLMELKKKLDYEEYGGAPLLGVNGVCIISHGKSKAKAIRNAIRVAKQAVLNNLVAELKSGV
jgi:glycerol-3-phosphate acyltransferase PlsX